MDIHETLSHYDSIGWDFDETLVGSPASEIIQEFIRKNPQIKHYIVTFRTHGSQHDVWDDLAKYENPLTEEHFVKVVNIADEAWEQFRLDSIRRYLGQISGPPTSHESHYIEWKGWACKEHGLPVLIDDRTTQVERGCTKYGIDLFHPLDF